MGAAIKSMTLEQARAYRDTLKKQGKSESTSKEYAKVADYIKVLKSQAGQGGYGQKELAAAYTNLSRGVTKAGGWTEQNADNIYKYTGTRPTFTLDAQGNPLGGGSGDVSSYLDGYQQSVYGATSSPDIRDSIVEQIEPDGGMPDTIDWSDRYDEWRDDLGVTDLEDSLNTLNDQLQTEMDITEERTLDAEGKPVAMGVISGRVTEIERQQQQRIRSITRQIDSISNQLNTAYNIINTYMQFERMEYQDAMDKYNTEFSRNLKIYELTMAEMDKQSQIARANLQLFTNAITGGNMSYDSLSADQKAFISKLEIQSGLPIGFVGSLHMKPNEKLLGTSKDGSSAVKVDENGNLIFEEMPRYTPVAGIGTKSEGGKWTYTGVTDSNKLGWSQNKDSSSSAKDYGLTNAQLTKAYSTAISLGASPAAAQKVYDEPEFALYVLSKK